MIGFTMEDLKAAMRDPRGWNGAHPEREAYGAWIQQAWKTMEEAGALEGGDTVVVQVKGYHRTRNGKREWVEPYEQTRKAAEAENDNAALVLVEDKAAIKPAPARSARTAEGMPVAALFIGGGGDAKSGIVRSYTGLDGRSGFHQLFPGVGVEYFSWDERERVESRIRALRAEFPGIRIHLVGHSCGGDTAAQISAGMAGRSQPIDLLVTVDPVGRWTSQGFFGRVRDGSLRWINVNATGGGRLERSNLIAGLGSSYDYGPMGHADAFLNVQMRHSDFDAMMQTRLKGGSSIASVAAGR